MTDTPSLTLREQIALALLKILAENKGKKIEIETDNGNTTGGKIKAIRDGVILEMTVETDGGGQEDGFINPLAIKELYIVQKEGVKPLEDEENNSLEEDESENKPKKPAELKN